MRKEGKKKHKEGLEVELIFSITSFAEKNKESALSHSYEYNGQTGSEWLRIEMSGSCYESLKPQLPSLACGSKQ